MSVVHDYEASRVKLSQEEKYIHIITPEGRGLWFNFTFVCTVDGFCAAFNMNDMEVMVITQSGLFGSPLYNVKYRCLVMKFWVENDLPIPSVKYWYGENLLTTKVGEQFKEKLASHLLDGLINS